MLYVIMLNGIALDLNVRRPGSFRRRHRNTRQAPLEITKSRFWFRSGCVSKGAAAHCLKKSEAMNKVSHKLCKGNKKVTRVSCVAASPPAAETLCRSASSQQYAICCVHQLPAQQRTFLHWLSSYPAILTRSLLYIRRRGLPGRRNTGCSRNPRRAPAARACIFHESTESSARRPDLSNKIFMGYNLLHFSMFYK